MGRHGTPATLTPKQNALLACLLTGKSVEQSATEVGIARSTAFRWAKEQSFKQALRDAQQEIFEEHLSLLRVGIKTALTTLVRNMGEKVSPSVQVTAAKAWLDNAVSLYKTDEEVGAMSVLLHPEWITLRAKLITTLGQYPEAKSAVIEALASVEGSNGHR